MKIVCVFALIYLIVADHERVHEKVSQIFRNHEVPLLALDNSINDLFGFGNNCLLHAMDRFVIQHFIDHDIEECLIVKQVRLMIMECLNSGHGICNDPSRMIVKFYSNLYALIV